MAKSKTGLIFKIILGILVVLIVLVVAVLFFIDPLAKNALEKGAPLILGTNVSVERIHIEPLNGRVEITNLIVDNPGESYSSEYAIKLGDIIADIDINTVLKDKIRIEEMFLKDVNVVYETNVINSNLQEILDNVKKLDTAEKTEKKEDKTDDKESKEKTLQVDLIELSSVGVTVQAKGAAAGLPIKVTIDPMTNLGTDEEGITPVGLTLRILGAIVTTAIKTAGGSVGDAAAAIGDAATDAVAGATSAAVDAANSAVNDATNAVGGAIKGLFGGKKDDAAEAQPQGN
ncbi:MAG: hypothetical protein IJT68_09120 [Lentisphaeria bacterium]|nr:hypothetical protein [Lentisphaeria bacterium]MBR3505912.1 hypothetical protein [Lentisphaeria bacterium]